MVANHCKQQNSSWKINSCITAQYSTVTALQTVFKNLEWLKCRILLESPTRPNFSIISNPRVDLSSFKLSSYISFMKKPQHSKKFYLLKMHRTSKSFNQLIHPVSTVVKHILSNASTNFSTFHLQLTRNHILQSLKIAKNCGF